MNIKGIEYHDAIDFRGGKENVVCNTALEYMLYPAQSNYITNEGLNIIEFYGTYRKFPSLYTWINFSFYIKKSGANGTSIFGNYVKYNDSNYGDYNINDLMQNKRAVSYNEAYALGHNSLVDRRYSMNVSSSGTAWYGLTIGSINSIINNPIVYNVRLSNYEAYYFRNGNEYLGSTATASLKFFCIGRPQASARSQDLDGRNTAILQWISLTDSPIVSLPQPPYVLSEKDDDMYGYKKEV